MILQEQDDNKIKTIKNFLVIDLISTYDDPLKKISNVNVNVNLNLKDDLKINKYQNPLIVMKESILKEKAVFSNWKIFSNFFLNNGKLSKENTTTSITTTKKEFTLIFDSSHNINFYFSAKIKKEGISNINQIFPTRKISKIPFNSMFI